MRLTDFTISRPPLAFISLRRLQSCLSAVSLLPSPCSCLSLLLCLAERSQPSALSFPPITHHTSTMSAPDPSTFHKPHRKPQAGRSFDKKHSRDLTKKQATTAKKSPHAFSVQSTARAARSQRRNLDLATRRQHLPIHSPCRRSRCHFHSRQRRRSSCLGLYCRPSTLPRRCDRSKRHG